MNIGILLAICAYTIWGLLPIFWKALQGVSAFQILCHRMVWALVFVIFLLIFRKHLSWIRSTLRDKTALLTFLGTSCILAVNWLTYLWAVNSGYIVEASLGYFINPILNVLLGVIFLKERLRPLQWMAVAIAACGVFYLTVKYGRFPWIAVTLALTFGFYGLIRKASPIGALEGLTLETGFLFIPSILCILFFETSGSGALGQGETAVHILLPLSGIATAMPLLLFAAAAKRIKLSTLGVIQYMAPTCQLLLGIFMYKESFPADRAVGFILVWCSLLIYIIDGLFLQRNNIERYQQNKHSN
ncbi:MAG: EamA family transporter RarD [Desulfobacterales bacterium]|nr:EamA family transporter RarD [Desulfobacterales bacterium]